MRTAQGRTGRYGFAVTAGQKGHFEMSALDELIENRIVYDEALGVKRSKGKQAEAELIALREAVEVTREALAFARVAITLRNDATPSEIGALDFITEALAKLDGVK
jgi:hypothetical protein